jgi:hypothetical protein
MASYRMVQKMFVAQRRAKVSELYLSGWTQKRIAAEIKVSEFTVSEDIHALIAHWSRTAGINISAQIATELERINNLEAAAWESFRKSQQPRRVASVRKAVTPVGSEGGTLKSVESSVASATEIHQPAGDPRFMAIIKGCIAERIRLVQLVNGEFKDGEDRGNAPKTFSDFVAMHLKEQERNGNGSTPIVTRPNTVELDPNRLP